MILDTSEPGWENLTMDRVTEQWATAAVTDLGTVEAPGHTVGMLVVMEAATPVEVTAEETGAVVLVVVVALAADPEGEEVVVGAISPTEHDPLIQVTPRLTRK